MTKKTTNYSGLFLILLGGLALLQATIFPQLGWDFSFWRFWPLGIGAVGLAFIVAPFIYTNQPGLKALFIPGFPVMVVGTLLLWGSLFNAWGIWQYFWPMILLGLAVGFLAASVFTRNVWLMIPAIIIGMNGLIFQFCALTGLWGAWAILWTLEPLAVGLALLVASGGKNPGLMWTGMALSAASVGGFALMSVTLSGWAGSLGAILLIVAGIGLVARGRGPVYLKEKSPDDLLVDKVKL
ncbi:hypothetical protein [Candidatus Leptofilum sp.]|uniref:hypothetical protein n=1 Tax=Candidatus Leptofilum sp. TaxID=3241576 RepID=UPI003B59FE45